MEIFYHNSKKNAKKIWLLRKFFISLQQQTAWEIKKAKKNYKKKEFFLKINIFINKFQKLWILLLTSVVSQRFRLMPHLHQVNGIIISCKNSETASGLKYYTEK